jgi:hypothetical protein
LVSFRRDNVKRTDPPALATALLELIPPRTSAGLIGDLIEEYRNGRSRTWYWQQTIVALIMSAFREGRAHKLQASTAIVLGYVCGASLCYFTTSAAGKFVGPYTVVGAYILFLPLAFISAATSGWILSRTHSRPMVLVFAVFCGIASVVALAMYHALFPLERMPPLPMTVVVLVNNFIIVPIGVLAGGLLGTGPSARPAS